MFISTAVCSAALVEVTGDRVNLRSAAGMPSDVVGQVNRGDLLELQGNIDDVWVKVTPPQNVDLWVASQYVENGIVTGTRVRVRAGASVNYKDVGIVDKGDKVIVRGKVGDWLKIAPPKASSVWITNAYVKAVDKNEGTVKVVKPQQPSISTPSMTTTTTTSTTTTTTVPSLKQQPKTKVVKEEKKSRRTLLGSKSEAKGDAVIGPAKIPQSKLRSDCEQAKRGSYTGRLEMSPKNAPARFRLVREVPGSSLSETECYIIGNTAQLKSILGQSFTFEGPIYWFNGTTIPTVYTESITRVRK